MSPRTRPRALTGGCLMRATGLHRNAMLAGFLSLTSLLPSPAQAQTALPAIPQLSGRLVQMRFYTSGDAIPGRRARYYSTRFDPAATKYVNVELEFDFEAPRRTVDFVVSCQYTKPDGGAMGPFEVKFTVQPAWANIFSSNGWGNAEGGSFVPGVYRARCTSSGVLVGESTFEMVAAQPEVTAANAKFTGMKFFESPRPMLAAENRKYGHDFGVATTRSVGVELAFRHPAPGRVVEFTVQCQLFKADGTDFGRFDIKYSIQPDWTTVRHAGIWGWEEAGKYTKGVYRVACSSDGKWIAESLFEVV